MIGRTSSRRSTLGHPTGRINSEKFRTLCALYGSIVWQYACNSHLEGVPSKSQRERKVQWAGSTVLTTVLQQPIVEKAGFSLYHCVSTARSHCLTTYKRFYKWITEFSEDLAARGQVIDKDVEFKIYCALSAPSGALVMMVPCWSLDYMDCIQENFLEKCGRRFRAVMHRMLCPGV
jgi:hypothetical protein